MPIAIFCNWGHTKPMIYQLKEMCKLLKLNYDTYRKKAQRNKLNAIKIGKEWVIDEDGRKFLESELERLKEQK